MPKTKMQNDTMKPGFAVSLLASLVIVSFARAAVAAEPDITTVRLNGLEISLDNRTGAIRRLEYPGPGILLEAEASEAGLLDAAYPIEQFEPLRLAARHSRDAVIKQGPDRVIIRMGALGPSRDNFTIEGVVTATVTLRASADERSVILSAELENKSARAVRQLIFPELRGLLATAGPDDTLLKTCGFSSAPFRELALPEADQWYAANSSTIEYKSGGMQTPMWARWLDLGSLRGGFGLFPRRWGWDPQTTTVLQLQQTTGKLRLFCVHPSEVPPGGKWSSGEWVLTPHRSGWAKGIEPYRAWVHSKVNPRYSMPKHIREGLGFRTLWMCQSQPNDPTDVVWRFRDLPGLAEEAKAHGLCEMVMWGWVPDFDASLPGPFPHLGTEGELVEAVRQCREIGVNVSPFISVLQANPGTAVRYGRKASNNAYTYHTDLIPRRNALYATSRSCVQVGPASAQWQEEVWDAYRRWADKGFASITWDQYWTVTGTTHMEDLTRRIRDYARKLDPESTFSGEELRNLEIDSDWLDYTWNWGGHGDYQAFVNAFPAPRRNININRSVKEARLAFMDNLFLNVWPSKPDGINGSERIANVAELSGTLKTCSRLRKQFLSYFTEGVLIGNCLLTQPSPGACMSAYVLPRRVLAIVLNPGAETSLSISYDVAPWLPGKTFEVTEFDESGSETVSRTVPAAGTLHTRKLRPLEMTVLEFADKQE